MTKLLAPVLLGTSIVAQAGIQTIPLGSFGDNPGNLTASIQLSEKAAPDTLVVLLHGCAQNATTFAEQSGFTALAEKKNWLLLLPQQSTDNNIKGCFNWFSAQDITGDKGEVQSLYNMIDKLKHRYAVNSVNIVGLSAGGAMTSAMLANYPSLFDNGAIIAGLPYHCADSLVSAVNCMKSGPKSTVEELTRQIDPAKLSGSWPKVSIWYGDKDQIVSPVNATFMAEQWVSLHGKSLKADKQQSEGVTTTTWKDAQGVGQVRLVELATLGHGMPVAPNKDGTGGTVAPYMPAGPISAAETLTRWWGY